jgi:hypothetical protein
VDRERSEGGRRGLKAGQLSGGFAGVEVLLDCGGRCFLGGILTTKCDGLGSTLSEVSDEVE